MQRTLLALAILVAGAATAGAQQASATSAPPPSTTSLGPVVGVNYTTFTGSDAQGADYHADAYIGALLDHTFGQSGMFRTGLVYSGRGAQTTDQGVTDRVRVHYLEVPLLLGYRFGVAGTARPYLMGGGNVHFKVGCKVEESTGGLTASADCDDPNVDLNVSSTDFSLAAGGGIAFPMGTSSTVDIHLTYAYGFTKLVPDANTKNAGFTLAVAYLSRIAGGR